MDYHPGQLVACVDDQFTFGFGSLTGLSRPSRGTVYTIRTVEIFHVSDVGCDVAFIRLEEIRNPLFETRRGPMEPVFEADAFLPLDPKRLDIFRHVGVPVLA